MHRALFLVVVFATVALVACDPGIGIRVENQSNALICFHEQGTRLIDPTSCVDEIQPGESVKWSVLCQSDWEMTIVLTSEDREIYSGSATCGEWEKTGARIVVERVDGLFEVTDSLGSQ